MADSSIPGFKKALRDRLQTLFAGTATQVSYGHPYPDGDQDELVKIGKATSTQEPATYPLQAGQRDEDYTLEILVSVLGSKQRTHETLEARAYEIAGDIEGSLLDWASAASPFDGKLGNAGWAYVQGMSDAEALQDDGGQREAWVTITVAASARI